MKGAPRFAQHVGDLENVLCTFLHVVGLDAIWPASQTEPAQASGATARNPPLDHRGNLVMPLPTITWQAVQQY